MAERMTREAARETLNRLGLLRERRDFHALDSDTVERLGAAARACGYRAPRQRNGSATRYFHAYLERVAYRGES